MVRRRGDQSHPRGGVAHLGDPRIHLVAGELTALAGLGPLGHLDLEVVGIHQVLAGDAEASGGHLLDGAPARVAIGVARVAGGILSALAGIGLAAHAVHGDGERLVGLETDGPVGHRAGGEAGEDRLHRLDLLDGDGPLRRLEGEEPPQGREVAGLLVHRARVVLEDPVLAAAGGVLELEHGVRVEEVILPLAPPLILAAPLELGVPHRPVGEGPGVARRRLLGDDVDAHAADPRGGPREVAVHEGLVQPDRLEDLGAPIGLDGGDPHLGDHLEHALVERLDVVLLRGGLVQPREQALADHVVQRLEGQVRVDGARTVPEQQRGVMHLPRVARLDDQAHLHAAALADEVMVHARGGEQRGNGRQLLVHPAVGQDQVGRAVAHRLACLRAHRLQGPREAGAALGHGVDHLDGGRPVAGEVGVTDARDLLVVEDGRPQLELPRGLGGRLQQVALGSDGGRDLRHQLFADAVQGRIRHLGEELLEVVVQEPRPVGEHGQRGVGAHGAHRLLTGGGHGAQEEPEVLVGIAEGLLALEHRLVIGLRHIGRHGQGLDGPDMGLEPLAVRMLGGVGFLELGVVDDPALRGVDQEDAARDAAAP